MPVPSVTITMSSTPRPAPTVHSARAAQVASLATATGPPEPAGEPAGDVELDHVGHVRRRPQHALDRDQPGRPDADRCRRAAHGRLELADDHRQHLDQRVTAARGRLPGLGDDVPAVVDHHAEALGAADVDPEGRAGHASARVFSSRTELRMRTSARRLTKPGSGAASSIARS